MAEIILNATTNTAMARSCLDCTHAYIGSGIYCSFFKDEIWSDDAANGCDEYKGTQT